MKSILAAAITALLLLSGCAKTMLTLKADEGSSLTLALSSGTTLTVTGPAELSVLCRAWGDSDGWTCSGGQLSENGSQAIKDAVEAAVKAALSSTGIGAAGSLVP